MKIPVHLITEQGYKKSVDHTQEWFVQAVQEALEGEVLSAKADFSLEREEDRVTATISYNIQAKITCMRCAVDIEMHHQGSNVLLFEPMATDLREEEREIQEEELEIGWYEEGKLDLINVTCEAIVLSLPMVMHCDLPFISKPNPDGCLVLEEPKDNTLENLFADLLKRE